MVEKHNKFLLAASLTMGALLLIMLQVASAFNPQPEPPANDRASIKSMQPLDKKDINASPPSEMRKAIEPGHDKPHAIDPDDGGKKQMNP